jgi:hypothetical protein
LCCGRRGAAVAAWARRSCSGWSSCSSDGSS